MEAQRNLDGKMWKSKGSQHAAGGRGEAGVPSAARSEHHGMVDRVLVRKSNEKSDKRAREDQKQLEERVFVLSWRNLTWRARWEAAVTGLH